MTIAIGSPTWRTQSVASTGTGTTGAARKKLSMSTL